MSVLTAPTADQAIIISQLNYRNAFFLSSRIAPISLQTCLTIAVRTIFLKFKFDYVTSLLFNMICKTLKDLIPTHPSGLTSPHVSICSSEYDNFFPSLLSFAYNFLSALDCVTYKVPKSPPKTPPPSKPHSSLIPDLLWLHKILPFTGGDTPKFNRNFLQLDGR